jgi:hypothetical protein
MIEETTMSSRSRQLHTEIAELQSREEAIERALTLLAPAGTRIVLEEYTGHVGDSKHREWDRLLAEKDRVQSELRRRYGELYRLSHPDTRKE